nr:restriction endonuclease subunit S [Candidatus Brachybacter algidus]
MESRIKGEIPYYGANGVQGYVEGFTHNGEFVLIAEDGANDLNNYPINYVNGKIWVNNHAHVLQGIISILGTRFLSYLLKSVDFKSVLVGGTRAKLNKSILEKIEFSFPSLPEQTRIATILSDMDAELEALGKKLGKARMIKQGMMQELLTGRVRLV